MTEAAQPIAAAAQEPPSGQERGRTWRSTLIALGVVYGDIGTSPLYALRECFHGPHAVPVTHANVLGVLSLILWSLILVISIKYLVVILRADNRGEGGILALLALLVPTGARRAPHGAVLVVLALFGAALLYGDGVITPAISVLSALEGLEVAAPHLEPFVVPLAVLILCGLFALQHRGSERVGALFWPVTLLWFVTLGLLGLLAVGRTPAVLHALSPHHALLFFVHNGFHGFVVLGSVFLVVTGGEALYADMGHFGRAPIRRAWFCVVLPALMLNYLGQGALLLARPELNANPFFHLAPEFALYPLIALSTLATVIASQAVITGAFSLTWQAIQLGFLPRFHVVHTSEAEMGQVFIPRVNQYLLVVTVLLVIGFRSSSALAAAYGIAVTMTMAITTVLAGFVMHRLWRWPIAVALVTCALFLIIDLGFLGANLLKVADGGWLPLSIGVAMLTVMLTWRDGRRLLLARLREGALGVEQLCAKLAAEPPRRIGGTAVYLTSSPVGVPPALLRIFRHFKVLHERVLLLHVDTLAVPRALPEESLQVEPLPSHGLYRVHVHYGFLEKPNVPRALARAARTHPELPIDPEEITYVLGRETLFATQRPGLALWREKLFGFLARNAGRPTEFFRIPPDRVIEIGAQIEL